MAEAVTVAVNGGAAGAAAVRWAVERSRSVDMRLEIMQVIPIPPATLRGGGADTTDQAHYALQAIRAEAEVTAPELEIITRVRHGSARAELIAASQFADLLVIGAHTPSALAATTHGTMAFKLAGQASCPTAVVPAEWTPTVGPVVVGWSHDATAESALDFAAREASARGVALSIVHSWGAPSGAAPDMESAHSHPEFVAARRALLAGAVHRLTLAHPELSITQGLYGIPAASAIARAAESASLIVIGSRGRGAVASLFLGSVSHDVLASSRIPVVVLPRRGELADIYPDLRHEDL